MFLHHDELSDRQQIREHQLTQLIFLEHKEVLLLGWCTTSEVQATDGPNVLFS